MKKIHEKIFHLAALFPNDIQLHTNNDPKHIYKGIGHIPGKIDPQLLAFLLLTNGAILGAYTFLGVKHKKPYLNIFDEKLELNASGFALLDFIPFATAMGGSIFGYISSVKDKEGNSVIAYLNTQDDFPVPYLIGSCFKRFMTTFLEDIEENFCNVTSNIGFINDNSWPLDINHWFPNDTNLKEMYIDKECFFDNYKIKKDGFYLYPPFYFLESPK